MDNRKLPFTFNRNADGLTTVNYDLEFSFGFSLDLTGEELFRQLAERVKITIKTLSRFIESESVSMMMQYSDNDLAVQNTAAMFEEVAKIISAYTDFLEMIVANRKEILSAVSDEAKPE